MKHLQKEDKAGLYITIIVHLTAVIILLVAGLDYSLKRENTFVLDFSKYEEIQKMQEQVEQLQKEAELQQAINDKLNNMLGQQSSAVRNVAVDRSALKDDRGTNAEQLYKDAERLAQELKTGFEAPDDDHAEIASQQNEPAPKKEEKKQNYSGPSVVSYYLEGRKASKLPIPAYRCMGAGEVTVLITVDPSGAVTAAKVDETCSSPDGCLRAFAIRAARLSRFSASPGADPKQSGNIVYQFIAQ